MKVIEFKRSNSDEFIKGSLDAAFIEALSVHGAHGGSSIEDKQFELDLLSLIQKNPLFLHAITEEFKCKIIKEHGFEIKL